MVDEKPTPKTAAKKRATAPDTEPKPEVEEELSPPASLSPAEPPKSEAPATVYHVVGNADQDEVHLKAVEYKNKYAKKSLTVHHVQRRLAEWGFHDAFADRDGYYGGLTKAAVAAFQTKLGLEATGILDAESFKRLFENDTNVKVVLS